MANDANPNYRSALFLCMAIILLASSPEANGALVSINPLADAPLSSANPNSNYGRAGALSVAAGGLPRGEFQSLIRFDLSTVRSQFDILFGAANWTIQSAELRLNRELISGGNNLFNTSAAGQLGVSLMATTNWVEGTGTPQAPGATGVNFNSLPTLISGSDQTLGSFAFNGATTGVASFPLSLTPGLRGNINSGAITSLRVLPLNATISALFTSNNNSSAADRPLLVIDAVAAIPEPSSFTCLGVFFASIGIFVAARGRLECKLANRAPSW